jgi:hypothetical protein
MRDLAHRYLPAKLFTTTTETSIVRHAPNRRAGKPLLLAIAIAAAWAPARAGTFELGSGVEGVWSLHTSVTSGWRATNPDPELIGRGEGGTASGYTATSTAKNFGKGDNFTTLFRVVGDINLRQDQHGLVLRAKAWDNYRLSSRSVPFGTPSNNFTRGAELDDSNFDTRLSRFRGVALLDAYVYKGFTLGEETDAKVKFGNHVVNFGESLFVPGVNQYSVVDVNALRQPGTLLKEAILPVPQISASLGLPGGASVEGFYQFKWRPTSIDGCGTYWSPAEALNCTSGSVLVASDNAGAFPLSQFWNGIPALGGLNFRVAKLADRKPADGGQFGFAFKKSVEQLDAELGAYFVNYSARVPNLSAIRDTTMIPGSVYYTNPATGGPVPLGSAFWDYSAKNIKVLGLSGSTVIGGWAVAGELSYTKDYPVPLSPVDLFYAVAAPNPAGGVGVGPLSARYGSGAAPLASNTYLQGYDRKNKVQLQLNTIKVLPNVLGASAASIVGEVAFQHWSGMGDPATGVRYGRGFEFGAGPHATFGGACPNSNTNNCTQNGYFTSNAWGLRALFELEYPGLISGVNLKPRVFLSQDVKGYSADSMFSKGRRVVSFGLRAEVAKRYYADISYTDFNSKARFDSFHDRDFFGLVLGMNF